MPRQRLECGSIASQSVVVAVCYSDVMRVCMACVCEVSEGGGTVFQA